MTNKNNKTKMPPKTPKPKKSPKSPSPSQLLHTRQLAQRQMTQSQQWLYELTNTPSVAGFEYHVIKWVERWAARRKDITLKRMPSGNLMLEIKTDSRRKKAETRVTLVAHMDHPGFMIRSIKDERTLLAEFRGGVKAKYFEGSRVRVWGNKLAQDISKGRITRYQPKQSSELYPTCDIRLDQRITNPSDFKSAIASWYFPENRVGPSGKSFRALACDNLAGVSAALYAMELFRKQKQMHPAAAQSVRLLLTRAEEIGFVGALACCQQSEIRPEDGPVIVLENSNALPEAPIGEGAIVRVGDRISTFDPAILEQMSMAASMLKKMNPSFKWQRKLMSGGSCEATAFCQWGYTAACACLPLGHYHNMNTEKSKIEPEFIALSDYEHLILLLTQSVHILTMDRKFSDRNDLIPAVKERLITLYETQKHILDENRS